MDRNALLGSDDLLEVVTDQMTLHAEVEGPRVRVLVGGEVGLATATALHMFIISGLTPGISESLGSVRAEAAADG